MARTDRTNQVKHNVLSIKYKVMTRHWPGLIARIRCYPLQIAEREEGYLRHAAALLDRSASHEEGLVRREIAPRLRRRGGHDVPAEEESRHERRATEAESATDRPSGRTIGEIFYTLYFILYRSVPSARYFQFIYTLYFIYRGVPSARYFLML